MVKKQLEKIREQGLSSKDINILENCFKQNGYRELKDINNILVIRVDNIGDFVIQSGFLRELRKFFPKSKITLVVSKTVYEIAVNCPYVNRVLVLDYNRTDENDYSPGVVADFILQHNLLKEYFDASFCTQDGSGSELSQLMAYFSGARIRIGFGSKSGVLLTDSLQEYAPIPEYKKWAHLLRIVGGNPDNEKPELWYSHSALLSVQEQILEHTKKLNNFSQVIFLCADSTQPRFMYSHYDKVIKELKDYLFIIVGKEDSNNLSGDNIISLVNKTTLQELCALPLVESLRDKKKLCLSNNTGTVHIMAANNIPCVQLCVSPKDNNDFITSDSKRFPPAFVTSVQVQPEHSLGKCKDSTIYTHCIENKPHCINQIKTRDIINAIRTLETVSIYN